MAGTAQVWSKAPAPAADLARRDYAVVLGFIALAALFAATHPFSGIGGDAKIYMGRALADADPAGVGRDLMFRLDGQSRFSVFPPIAAWLVSIASPLSAARWIVATGGVLWFCALVVLLRRIAPQRFLACAAVVIVAPATYGGFDLLKFGESLAEPRPFAEAFVLLSIAAFIAGRRWLAIVPMIAAVLFHPIMALAGVATLFLALCFEDRRWLWLAAGGCVLLAGAVVARLPLADRLTTVVDQDWLDLLLARNVYLFPHLWPQTSFVLPAVQAATIALAAQRCEPPLRRLLLASLASGLIGLGVAWICGLYDPVLLIVQAQTWRMWWLTSLFAAVSLALAAIRLGRGDPSDRVALACLVLAWTLIAKLEIGAVALAIAACVIAARPTSARLAISMETANRIWLVACVAVVAFAVSDLSSLREFGGMFQPGYSPRMSSLVVTFVAEVLILAAVSLAAFGAPRWLVEAPRAAQLASLAVALPIAALAWNDVASDEVDIDHSGRSAELAALAPNRAGEVLWVSGTLDPWMFLGRPHWAADIQGAGIVFSRELAMTYRERAKFLIANGLAGDYMIQRFPFRPKTLHPAITLAAVEAVCRRADAPTYVIAPIAEAAPPDPALKARIWKPRAVRIDPFILNDKLSFARFDAYLVIDCADHR